ncbi:MAG: hypothetical protein WBA00_10325 [Rhodococcus sp. (in: high G+C Gram-positive bacteria)]
MAVVRILWRHKLVALPFVILTAALFLGALLFGPRAYQATSSFAMITPSLPSPLEIEQNPELASATDNPYLRSSDPTLVLQVGKTRLSSDEAITSLQSDGLSTDFTVGQGLSTSAQILSVTSNAADPDVAVASVRRLGEILDEQIRDVQMVNGASQRYLITVQPINEATGATERISSRLRNAAVAGIGGLVLLIAAVAVARSVDESRRTAAAPVPPEPKTQRAPQTSLSPRHTESSRTTEIPAVSPAPSASDNHAEPTRRSVPNGSSQGVIPARQTPTRQSTMRPAPVRPTPPTPVRRSTTVSQQQPSHPTRIGSRNVLHPNHRNT